MPSFEINIDTGHRVFEAASGLDIMPRVMSELIGAIADQALLLDYTESARHDISYKGEVVGEWMFRDLVGISLTGFIGSYDTRKKIAAIKAVRSLPGLGFGLKESKDLVEEIDNSLVPVSVPGRYDPDIARAFETEMAIAGYAVKIS